MKKEISPLRPAEKSEGIDLYAIFQVLWQYRKPGGIILTIASLTLVGFMLLTAILPPQLSPLPNIYRATALISLNQRGYSDLFNPGDTPILPTLNTSGGAISFFNYGAYIIRLIQSPSLLDKLIAEFSLKERYHVNPPYDGLSREELLRHLELEFDEKTFILSISCFDYDPSFAAKLVNRLCELLNQKILNLKKDRHSLQKELLARRLAEAKAELSNAENRLKDFQNKYGVIEIGSLADEKTNILASLRAQLILKEVEIRSYLASAQIEDTILKRLRSERDNLKKIIIELEEGTSNLTSDLPSHQVLSELVINYKNLSRDYYIRENIYETLLKELEILKVRLSLISEEPTFQIIEEATDPDTKYGPPRLLLTILGLLALITLCILAILGYNWFLSHRRPKQEPFPTERPRSY